MLTPHRVLKCADHVTCLLRSCAGTLDFPEYFLEFPDKEHDET